MGSRGFLTSILFGFILFGCTIARDDSDPLHNVNLSIFDKWRSAYMCLQKIPHSCEGLFRLTEEGWVNVTKSDREYYCGPNGCADQARDAILCVSLVHRTYKFRNGARVHDINTTINNGCDHGNFTGTTVITSNAWKMHESKSITFITALAAWIFISFLNM